MDRRERALKFVDISGRGLEIGPDGTDGFEFYVTLAKGVQPAPVDRIETLLRIEAELAAPRARLATRVGVSARIRDAADALRRRRTRRQPSG